jgi:chromosome segregation ATPase
MDTMTATAATKRVAELHRQLAGLRATKQQNENGLAGERSTLRSATESRAALVAELTGADEALAGFAHAEIDGLDVKIRTSDRHIESFTAAIARIDGHIVRLTAELNEAAEIAEQERRAQAFTAFRTQIGLDRRAAEAALDAARSALFALNRTAVQGTNECGEAGRQLVAMVLEEFLHEQHNPEALLGWRSVGFELSGDLQIAVKPMVKGAAKP